MHLRGNGSWKKVLKANQRTLGSKHIDTLESINNFAKTNQIYESCDRYASCHCCAITMRIIQKY